MNLNKSQQRDMLIYSFRYALGRMSVAPHVVCEIIEKNIDNISKHDKALFIREIREADKCHGLGDERINAPLWNRLRGKFEEELKND